MGAVGVWQLPVLGVRTRGAVNVQIQHKRSVPVGFIRTGAAPGDVAVLLTALVTVTEALPCHVQTMSCSDFIVAGERGGPGQEKSMVRTHRSLVADPLCEN